MKKFLLVLGIVSFFILTISLLTSSCKVAEGMESADLDKSISSALSQIENLPGMKGSSKDVTVPGIKDSLAESASMGAASTEKAVAAPAPVGLNTASNEKAVVAPAPVGLNTASNEKAVVAPAPVGMKSAGIESFVPCMESTKFSPIQYY